jgi:branched-chain amino acid transport system ATP-binding protein
MNEILKIEGVIKAFGGVRALDDIDVSLDRGTVFGVIGPNGSGKTTLLNAINGVVHPDSGRIHVRGLDTTNLPSHRLAAMGVMRTFQNPRVFETITVRRNMLVPLLHSDVAASEVADRATELLDLIGLTHLSDLPASGLSGGQQKLLEFARALMTEPDIVLMDEPFGGMHPGIKSTLIDRIKRINSERRVTFVIVSHEIPNLMELSDRVVCLHQGRLIADGTADQIRADDEVVEAYLGR